MSGLRLHTYWRSGASHRVRIALALKGLAYESVAVNLAKGGQREPAFLALNPQGFAPMLETPAGDRLIQSQAIMEWLEETYPDPPLLPGDAAGRAQVRALAAIPACDIHPLGNLRVVQALKADHGADDAAIVRWMTRWCASGFAAAEALMADAPGPWAHGPGPTLADCALVPQIYAAVSRYAFDMAPYPRLAQLAAAAEAHPAFRAAHPDAQPDAPGATRT